MKNILVVEDDSSLLQIYQEYLQDEGYHVETALQIPDALKKIAATLPDLILLDLMLPGGQSGYDLLKKLKANDKYKNIPVIILTNLDSEKGMASQLGAADYIIKANTSLSALSAKVRKNVQS